ncbi:hypothetical protein NL108_018105 [Boleophthalmus pectinirostris]|nr:hypothetical protein NL108_018105 [Boleophthalmus pectinirostris]
MRLRPLRYVLLKLIHIRSFDMRLQSERPGRIHPTYTLTNVRKRSSHRTKIVSELLVSKAAKHITIPPLLAATPYPHVPFYTSWPKTSSFSSSVSSLKQKTVRCGSSTTATLKSPGVQCSCLCLGDFRKH